MHLKSTPFPMDITRYVLSSPHFWWEGLGTRLGFSLVSRPCRAFHCLQYEKAGRTCYIISHERCQVWQDFSECRQNSLNDNICNIASKFPEITKLVIVTSVQCGSVKESESIESWPTYCDIMKTNVGNAHWSKRSQQNPSPTSLGDGHSSATRLQHTQMWAIGHYVHTYRFCLSLLHFHFCTSVSVLCSYLLGLVYICTIVV